MSILLFDSSERLEGQPGRSAAVKGDSTVDAMSTFRKEGRITEAAEEPRQIGTGKARKVTRGCRFFVVTPSPSHLSTHPYLTTCVCDSVCAGTGR